MEQLEILSSEEFDEQAYVEFYDDIQVALQTRAIQSAWWHYDNFGRAEGRKGFRKEENFDAHFYRTAYPIVKAELAAGLARTAHEHFLTFGRARGFLPAEKAARPNNACAMDSAFGGLWPDAPNAADIVQGKLEIGQITDHQASLLSSWISDGYVILEKAIPEDVINAAVADMDKAFSGGFKKLLFECNQINSGAMKWNPQMEPYPTKALDLHHFSLAVREVMFAPAISEFLGLIFESKALATQSLGFLRGSSQEGHQDSAYVPFTLPRSFAATWVALEDVTIGAGELYYYVGSHKFPDFLYGGRFKSLVEAERCGYTVDESEIKGHLESLRERARTQNIEKKSFAAKKGDVLVWHADLVHGGNPVSDSITRKSFVTHYCPKRLAPLFSERIPKRSLPQIREKSFTDLFEHHGHSMTSQFYWSKHFVKAK